MFLATAILSRQALSWRSALASTSCSRKSIVRRWGVPKGEPPVPGIFAAVPYCVDLIGGPYIETDPAVCKAFRPKSAVRADAPPAT